jgi:hypothetical protein
MVGAGTQLRARRCGSVKDAACGQHPGAAGGDARWDPRRCGRYRTVAGIGVGIVDAVVAVAQWLVLARPGALHCRREGACRGAKERFYAVVDLDTAALTGVALGQS